MSKNRQLDTLAVWRPIVNTKLSIREHKDYQYHSKAGIVAVSKFPVYRYAKNYTYKNQSFSLMIITQDANQDNVETFLDKQYDQVKTMKLDGSFQLLDIFYVKG